MARLDEIVSELEKNERPLDESIQLFEEVKDIMEKNGGESDAD